MLDDPDPIPTGTTGTVTAVRQQGTRAQVDVDWDNGRKLMLVVPPDQCSQVSKQNRHPLELYAVVAVLRRQDQARQAYEANT